MDTIISPTSEKAYTSVYQEDRNNKGVSEKSQKSIFNFLKREHLITLYETDKAQKLP